MKHLSSRTLLLRARVQLFLGFGKTQTRGGCCCNLNRARSQLLSSALGEAICVAGSFFGIFFRIYLELKAFLMRQGWFRFCSAV